MQNNSNRIIAWFNRRKETTAIFLIILAFLLLTILAFFLKPTGWRWFVIVTPLILRLIGGRWIAPKFDKFKQEIVVQFFMDIVTGGAVILSSVEFVNSTNFLAITMSFFLSRSSSIIVIMLFIALSSPLCRLVERQTQRTVKTKKLTKKDVKYWFKDTFITNFSGWMAMCGVTIALSQYPEMKVYEPHDFLISNAFLSIICIVIFYIILNNNTKQLEAQEKIDNSSSLIFNDDEGKDFSITAIAQLTNHVWLWCVGFVCIVGACYLFCFAWDTQSSIEWSYLLIISFFVMTFFVSCSFGREHNWAYVGAFIIGTPVVLVGQALYIYLSWDHTDVNYLWRLAIPIVYFCGYIVYVAYSKKKYINIIDHPTISCLVYFFAALPSLAFFFAFVG